MKFDNKVLFPYDFIPFLREENLISKDNEPLTISISSPTNEELMVYLKKDEETSLFVAYVYKTKKCDKFEPHKFDVIKRFEENNEYLTVYFDKFLNAINFLEFLPYRHPDYKYRPQKVDKS